MKTLVISYSLTGNNAKLAQGLGNEMQADHIELRECKKRKIITIIFDVIFNRIPKLEPLENDLDQYDTILFVAPVWMGMVASPLRSVFRMIEKGSVNYAFISISAGADGVNTKLEKDLIKRIGRKPLAVINPLISDLLQKNSKPTRKELDTYRLTREDSSVIITDVCSRLSFL